MTKTTPTPQDPPLVPKDIPIPPKPSAGNGVGDAADQAPEQGGQSGPEPTRYGDWEKGGRCTDF